MRFSLPNCERWIWYAFLATIAWQTRIILWQADMAFIEWRSISLYVTDVLMLSLFALAIIQGWRVRWRKSDWVLVGLFCAAAISLRSTDQLTVSLAQLAQLVRLVQYGVLYWYVRDRAIRRFDVDMSLMAFVVGAIGQSVLALAQYLLQHDVGIRWLGETVLDPTMRGVAVFYDLSHVKILRAYGTLPHPNVLAVYLMTALWALGWLFLRHGRQTTFETITWAVAGVLMLWALYATYSRTMIAVWATTTLLMLIWHWRQVRVREMALVALIASLVFGGIFWRQVIARAAISTHEEAVTLRVYYAKEALGSGSHSLWDLNWTGVGIGNFVTWLRQNDPGHPIWMYQPAHDLYLLVYSELGIIGIGTFVAWLILIARRLRREALIVFAAFLAVALFDHFFWTLQQGRILFWLVAGLASAYEIQSHRTTPADSR